LSKIIHPTAIALIEALGPDFMKTPSSEQEWEIVAEGFWKEWNFPNCVGALDGKHIAMTPPPGSGTEYYNYKGGFSIVRMAMVDSDYRFIYPDVGTNGKISDGGVFGKSTLKRKLEMQELSIPPLKRLPYSQKQTPFVVVADDAFGLKPYLMRPYPGTGLTHAERIYNYR